MVAPSRKRLEALGVGTLVLALGVLGFLHKGMPAAEVDLNDGGVWVSNGNRQLVAHLNYKAQTLDGGLPAGQSDFDLSQFGVDVLVDSANKVQPLDPASVTFLGAGERGGGIEMAHGGSTVLFADTAKGKVWVTDTEGAAGFNPASEPTFKKLDKPRVAVSSDGVGFVISTTDGEVSKLVGSGRDASLKRVGDLGGKVVPETTFTTVGEELVGLEGARILRVGKQFEIDGLSGAALQQPSVKSNEVAVAGVTGLWRIPLSGAKPKVTQVPSGAAAAPVVLDGCVYGLWAQSGYYLRDCGGRDQQPPSQFPELAEAKDPVFRVNRSALVINDLVSGATYIPLEDSLQRVDNWDLISAEIEEQEKRDESEDTDETEYTKLQEFTEDNHPPIAVDDPEPGKPSIGARAGESATIPVLLNDVDPDGDVLTAVVKSAPDGVTVVPAKDGRAIRVDIPSERTGSFSFEYQAFDGVELSNVAKATVKISPAGSNEAPQYMRKRGLRLSERSTTEYSVLSDWMDPDGDPMYLVKAVGEEGLKVIYRPDGFISVEDLGTGGPGRRNVTLTVSDGTDSTTEEMVVQVTPGSSDEPPIANNDHYVVNVGEAVVLNPLANDTDPEGKKLRLTALGSTTPEVEASTDAQNDTVNFKATKAGSQTLVYSISDGPNNAKGKIRVDVVDPKEADDTPAAEDDLALLPTNGFVILEPLRNDFDPAGGVLVIQGISKGDSEGLNVEVVQHSLLRITAPAGISSPQTFEYTVSNGKKSTSAKVLVVPLPEQSEVAPPVTLPDKTVVRAGDIVSIDVLENDYSPSELPLKLLPELDLKSGGDLGEFFSAGDTVRFAAGKEPGTAEVIYTVQDSLQNISSSTVQVTIKDFDERNQQPKPPPVEARTFAGSEVRIPVPMDGIDPDGDSVELSGVGKRAPQFGAVTVKGDHILYQASPESGGTDVFNYVVKDRFGAQGEGMVRVGVAPAPTQNQAPVAVPDEISVRPGTKVEIPVVENDVDPDGDEISIVSDSVKPTDDRWKPDAEIRGQKVLVTAPNAEGIYQFYYSITDNGGVPVKGVATVNVDEKVPLVAPIARDDYVAASEITAVESVEVDVLVNDEDPDGDSRELKLSAPAPAIVNGGKITVPIEDDRQVILHTVTDSDDLTAKAAIVVPGKDQAPPVLAPGKVPAKVKGGETLTVSLDEYVLTRPNHSATLTSVDSVVAGPGGDSKSKDLGLKVLDDRTIAFTPDAKFIGKTSLTFEVTDGTNLDDPRGLRATLSLPIEVESSGLFPPDLRPSEVTVAPGEDPLEVSLADMVDDPDPGDNEKMAYSLISASEPISASVSGQRVMVSVPAKTPVGTAGNIVVSVHDGSTERLEMTIPVRVITSTRPLMTVQDFTEPEGRVGKPTTVNLTDLVTNPFADKGGKISIVGNPKVSGPASVTTNGTVVTITPRDSGSASDSAEDVVVTYTVADATEDASRHRVGTIRVIVKDVPKSPTNVAAKYVASKTAEVSWTQGAWRGGTPKGFTVNWGSGSKDCGLQTTCVISTLANNNTYTFTVTASVQERDIADSAPSAASNPIFVDVRPNTPAAPTAKFGDKKIDLTWAPTSTPDGGSPVTKYIVKITPADTSGRTQLETSATSLVWNNLANGTAYTFTITAHNKLTLTDNKIEPPTGPSSAPEIPAGAPSNQGAPKVVMDTPKSGVSPRANVTWSPPGNPNGDTSFQYELRESGSSGVVYSGSSPSATVTMQVSTQDKTFQVRTTNKSGLWSDWSPASNAVRAFQPPGAPSGFTVEPTGKSNEVTMSFGDAAGNGAKPGEISYRWSANGQSGTISSGGKVANGGAFPNGQDVNVSLKATSTVMGESAEGPGVTAKVNAYGAPLSPGIGCSRSELTVTCNWSGGSGNGRSPVFQLQVDGGSWSDVAASGQRSVSTGYSTTVTMCARTVAANSASNPQCANARTVDPPQASLTVAQSGRDTVLYAKNFPAGSYELRCWNASYDNYRWATDYLGIGKDSTGSNRVQFPAGSSTKTIRCLNEPKPGDFSVEVYSVAWSPAITWR